MKAKRNIAGLAVGLLLGFAGVWLGWKLIKRPIKSVCAVILKEDGDEGSKKERPSPVESYIVKPNVLNKRIETVGKLQANQSVVLKAENHGRITKINFKEGEEIEAGKMLIKFDDSEIVAAIKEAEAELYHANVTFERVKQLQNNNVSSKKDFEDANAKRKMAEAKLESAKAKFAKTEIIAPFEGTIGLREIDVGNYVQAGQELATLVDNIPIKVSFKIPEKNLSDVGVGQIAQVIVDSFSDKVFNAVVTAIDAQADYQSHSIAIKAEIANEDNLLKAGLFAKVSLIIGEKTAALTVPVSSVMRQGPYEFVYVIQKGKAIQRPVITATREENFVEIIHGLKKDEEVITAGHQAIYSGSGSPVEVIKKADEKEDTSPTENSKNGAKARAANKKELKK